jgi:hypothetical protein
MFVNRMIANVVRLKQKVNLDSKTTESTFLLKWIVSNNELVLSAS